MSSRHGLNDLCSSVATNPSHSAPRGAAPSRVHPKVVPGLRVNSVLAVMELISMGLGIGVLPVFLAAGRPDLAERLLLG